MMNEREIQIAGAILRTLKDTHGGQLNDAVLHAGANLKCLPPKPSLAEFESVRDQCDTKGWITGVASQATGQMKWSLADKGLAALRDLT